MNMQDWIYKMRGINPAAKRAYMSLFNTSINKDRADKVINDLILKFHFYGAKPTTDPLLLAKQAGHREVIEYILTMAARVSNDTLSEIERIINRGGNDDN